MKSNVRIESTENIVKDAGVYIRGEDGEWIDIREMVGGIQWMVQVGDLSQIDLRLQPAEVLIEGRLSVKTLEAMAEILRANRYEVSEQMTPEEVEKKYGPQ